MTITKYNIFDYIGIICKYYVEIYYAKKRVIFVA